MSLKKMNLSTLSRERRERARREALDAIREAQEEGRLVIRRATKNERAEWERQREQKEKKRR